MKTVAITQRFRFLQRVHALFTNTGTAAPELTRLTGVRQADIYRDHNTFNQTFTGTTTRSGRRTFNGTTTRVTSSPKTKRQSSEKADERLGLPRCDRRLLVTKLRFPARRHVDG